MRFILRTLLILAPINAWAGRPFFTDDANLTATNTCQLETWWQSSKDNHQWWALSSCSPFSNAEITFGANFIDSADDHRIASYLLQGKTLFRQTQQGNYGYGLAFGMTRSEHQLMDAEYAYIPFSLISEDGTLVTNLNLGWSRSQLQKQNQTTWGMGTQYAWNKKFSSFGEVFGTDRTKPTLHVGLSLTIIPNYLQLDTTYGRNLENERNKNFYTVGADVFLPPFK